MHAANPLNDREVSAHVTFSRHFEPGNRAMSRPAVTTIYRTPIIHGNRAGLGLQPDRNDHAVRINIPNSAQNGPKPGLLRGGSLLGIGALSGLVIKAAISRNLDIYIYI